MRAPCFALWLSLVACPFAAEADVVVFPAPAAQERELVIYSSLDSPLARPLVEAFQRHYPDVAVRYEDLLTQNIAARVADESDAGGPTADLVFSSAMDLTVKLANDGYGRAVAVPGAARWPEWASWHGMVFALTFEPAVIVYHRPSFPNGAPDTRAELMDWLATAPQGAIGTYDIARSAVGFLFLMRDREHFADLWPLIRAMGRAGVRIFPTSQAIIDGVNSGALKLGYNVLGSYAADQATRLPNLGLALPQDYVVVVSRVALVPAAAANPELGETFLAFLMSREGQTVLAERLRLPAISLEVAGEDSAAAMQRALGPRLRPVPVSPGLLAYIDRASRARVMEEWTAALTGTE